jgi:hypothetical protein
VGLPQTFPYELRLADGATNSKDIVILFESLPLTFAIAAS